MYWLWSGDDAVDADADKGAGGASRGGGHDRAGDRSGLTPKKLTGGEVDLQLAARAALSGTVRDPDGEPVEGARVCASPRSKKLLRSDLRAPFCALTRADGGYRIEGLFPVPHALTASAPEYKPTLYSSGEGSRARNTVPLSIGGERTGVDLILKPGGVEIRGTVLDISGGILEGAQVRSRGAMAETDEEGRFSLWVDDGVWVVRANAEGYAPGSDRGAAPGHDFELFLTPEAVLVGKVVVAGSEAPVAGISVTSFDRGVRSRSAIGPGAVTGADGSFRIDGLDPGEYKPTAFSDEHYGVAKAQVQLGVGETSEPVRIEVHPALAVTGSIIPDDGEVCDKGYVRLSAPQSQRWFSAGTEPDGSVHLQGVLPGRYDVTVTCEGYVSEDTYEALLIEAASVGHRWSVVSGQTIRGRVLTALGEPALPMRANLRMKVDPAAPRGRQASIWGQKVEDDGTFTIYGVAPGTHALTFDGVHPGPDAPVEVIVTAGDDIDGLTVELPAAGSVKGRVIDERGEPVGDVQIGLVSKERRGVISLTGASSTSTRAADDGTFEIEHVRAGDYRATAMLGMMNTLRSPGTTDDDVQGVELRVKAGETAQVELRVEAKGASIRGRVVDAEGGPVADAFLSATRESDSATKSQGSDLRQSRWGEWDRRPVLTEQDGSFTLDDLTVGTYTVHARRKGGGEGFAEGVATDSEVTVSLEATGALAGVVAAASGSLPEEFSVTLQDRESGYARDDMFFRTDGSFSFADVPEGIYEVSVTAGRGTANTKVTLEAGEERSDLELELTAQVSLRGRLVDLDTGEPVAGMQVLITPRGGGNSFRTAGGRREEVSDANGAFELHHAPSGEVELSITTQSWGGASDYAWTSISRTLPAEPKVQELGTIELVKKRVADQQRAGSLGFSLREQEPDEAWSDRALTVGLVRPGGPAAKSGLQVGDVIIAVNGHDVRGEQSYRYFGLVMTRPGKTVTLGLASGASVTVVAGPPR